MAILLGLGKDVNTAEISCVIGQIQASTGGYTSTGAGNASSIHAIRVGGGAATAMRLAVYDSDGSNLLAESGEIDISSGAGEYSDTIDLDIDDATTYLLVAQMDSSGALAGNTDGVDLSRDAHTFGAFPATFDDTADALDQELSVWLEGTEGGGSIIPQIMHHRELMK